ncbi:MAG: deoxyribose-phosphate aldolase [Kineosporiaceae bacterium]
MPLPDGPPARPHDVAVLAEPRLAAALDDDGLAELLDALDAALPDPGEQVARILAAGGPEPSPRLADVETLISAIDLTTLEATDPPSRVLALAEQALQPDPDGDPITSGTCPRVAAVCVYPDLVEVAARRLAGTGVAVASVAGAFPSGRATLATRLADVADALQAGADEIDMVIDRGAFLDARYAKVLDDVAQVRRVCDEHRRGVHLKVILETGELGTARAVRDAGWLALLGGADVVKTSTGKAAPAATPESAAAVALTVRTWSDATGARAGVKVAGGVRTAQDALGYLALLRAAGLPVTPDRFRIGASSLLAALVGVRRELLGG